MLKRGAKAYSSSGSIV